MINFFDYKHLGNIRLRWRRITFICCTTILLYSCSVSKNYNPNKKYSKQQLQQDYSLLKNILEKKHPALYWYTSADSMNYYFDKYNALLTDSMTEHQFGWKVLAPLLSNIHCGHTSFMMSKGYNKWIADKRLPSFPLFFKVWNDTLAVTNNLNRKDSIFKRGTIVKAINGKTSTTLINDMFNHLSEDGYANNVNYIRLSSNFPVYHRNIYGLRKMYDVEYIDSIGNTKMAKLPLFEIVKDTSKKATITPLVKQPKPTKEQRLLAARSLAVDTVNNTAIITLNTFGNVKLRKFFRQTFIYIKKTGINNVVLDIRSNGGGKMDLSTLLTKYVSRKKFKVADTAYAMAKSLKPYSKYIKGRFLNNLGLFFFTKKKSDVKYHFGMWERKWYKPKTKNHFDGNLYVLTNGQTFSASTLFCNAVKGQPGITLVGEETGGGWHGNSGILIPDIILPNTKLRVRLPLFRLVQYNHVPKNGTGVMPDVYVPTSYDALLKGIDRKMEVVMEMIKSYKQKAMGK
jgi:C-terminal processing protease CtpA/Prc